MYTPKAFQETDQQKIKDFIRDNSFGILFSQNGVHPEATHLPLVFDGDDLVGHFAKANPHWRTLDGREAIIVFPGPHSYISSSWYGEEAVPTWNYMTVHVRGTCRIIEDREELLSILKQSSDFYEAPLGHAWRLEEHQDVVEKMLRGIVGVRISVRQIEAKSKLSQNHSKERQKKVIRALDETYDLYDSKEIAKEMKDRLSK